MGSQLAMQNYVSQTYSTEYQPDAKRLKTDSGMMGGQFDGACDEGRGAYSEGSLPGVVCKRQGHSTRKLPQLDGDFDGDVCSLDELLSQDEPGGVLVPQPPHPPPGERGSTTAEGRDL